MRMEWSRVGEGRIKFVILKWMSGASLSPEIEIVTWRSKKRREDVGCMKVRNG